MENLSDIKIFGIIVILCFFIMFFIIPEIANLVKKRRYRKLNKDTKNRRMGMLYRKNKMTGKHEIEADQHPLD